MNKWIGFLLLLSVAFAAPFSLGRRTLESPPDTLEVIVLKVEFQKEDPDNSLTTGVGLFNSDPDTTDANYSLDPQGKRHTQAYWQSHFDYANHYFQTVSGGKLSIKMRMFPTADDSAYKVPGEIIDYNRTQRNKEEKLAEFDSSRAANYLRFVQDAIYAADTSGSSPFDLLEETHPRTHRAYMVLHAGASKMVDGGGLGTQGADTPGDFVDAFLDKSAFEFLRDREGGEKDTLGILIGAPALDTLQELIVFSENHSQDELNWGSSGMLIHLLGKAAGLPLTYNVSEGISKLGFFDVMDFAGANAANGFFPVYPSAWVRSYLGWDQVTVARPAPGQKTEIFDLRATGSKSTRGHSILKIPLNAQEYLLVENRQRVVNKEGTVTLKNEKGEDFEVVLDSLHLFFQDSICNPEKKNDCKVNKQKASGIITELSHYDAGLPGSGLVIWHVNEWLINESLKYGFVNASHEGALGDHFHGISLVEADGVLSIGKEFKNNFGRPSYDYGTGQDLIPSITYKKSGKNLKNPDTITVISPHGYANTNSLSSGKTHLSLRAIVPDSFRVEKVRSSFTGDSLINVGSEFIKLEVHWGSSYPLNSEFPVEVQKNSGEGSIVFNHDIADSNVFLLNPTVGPLAYTVQGEGQGRLADSLFYQMQFDSVRIPLDDPALGNGEKRPVPLWLNMRGVRELSAKEDTVWVHNGKSLERLVHSGNLSEDLLARDQYEGLWLGKPVITELGTFVAEASGLHFYEKKELGFKLAWPKGFVFQEMAWDPKTKALWAVGAGFEVLSLQGEKWKKLGYEISSERKQVLSENLKVRMLLANVQGGEAAELFLLGSQGAYLCLSAEGEVLSDEVVFPRAGDNAGLGMADLDGDGLPELLFTANQSLFAVRPDGSNLEGFPYTFAHGFKENLLSENYPTGLIASTPLAIDADGEGNQDVLVATPNGLVYAVSGEGKLLRKISNEAYKTENEGKVQRVSHWPLAAGRMSFNDSLRSPFIHLAIKEVEDKNFRLFALSEGQWNAWELPLAKNRKGNWLMSGGNSLAWNYFDTAELTPEEGKAKKEILSFFAFPNPLKSSQGKLQIELGAEAEKAEILYFDESGAEVKNLKFDQLRRGVNRFYQIDCEHLGSGLYTLRLEVRFQGGGKKVKWARLAVIR